MVTAFIDINVFLIGILVSYFMYTAVNMIHQFSRKGRLPREFARKRFKCFIITLTIFSLCILAAYCSLSSYAHAKMMP